MSTTGKIDKLLISNKNPKRRINILLKDTSDNIIYTETIDYNEKKHKSCLDIAQYICDKFDYQPGLFCNYDKATQINYTFNDAKVNGDYINWQIDFNSVSIKDSFKGAVDHSITVTIINLPYGLGNTSGIPLTELFGVLVSLIKPIIWIIKYYQSKKNPYKKLQEEYHVDEDFVNKTILLGETWKYGFISREKFEFKNVIEKCIMKKLRYKKKNNNWIKVDDIYAKKII